MTKQSKIEAARVLLVERLHPNESQDELNAFLASPSEETEEKLRDSIECAFDRTGLRYQESRKLQSAMQILLDAIYAE